MGSRGGQFGTGGDSGVGDLEDFRERLLDHPDEEVAGNSNDNRSRASGNEIHIHGLTPGQGLAIAGLAAFSLGLGIANMVQSSRAQADMLSRYEESYRGLAVQVGINTNATDDMRASLIARDINPNNHDVTDVGGNKP